MADNSTGRLWDPIVAPWHLDEHIPDFPIPVGATETIWPTQIEECLATVCATADVAAAGIACAWLPDRVSAETTREAITRLARALGAHLAWHEPTVC
jgi:arginase